VPKFWVGARPIAASVLALVVAGACVTVSAPAASAPGVPTLPPGVSIPPIPSFAIPSISIPSISIPSIAIPSISIPSLNLPSLAIPSFEIPSIGVPSIDAGGGDCSILSTAKAIAATGVNWTLAPGGTCTYIDATGSQPVSGFNLRMGSASDTIATAKLIDPNGQDLSVAGHAAFWGPTFHQLYVDLGGSTLVILFITSDNAAALDLAQKLANAYFAQ
jgi:hypothetical protein